MATETVSAASREFEALAPSLEGILHGLFRRASDRLTVDDLQVLSAKHDDAMAILVNVTRLSEGVASLVNCDRDSGSFQSGHDLPNLLYAIGDMATHARALLSLSAAADLELQRGPRQRLGQRSQLTEVRNGNA